MNDEASINEYTTMIKSNKLLWGTYRSNLYFGTRARTENSLLTGLLWYPKELGLKSARHTCEINDGLKSYGWIMHDGYRFGHELIKDPLCNLILDIKFLKSQNGCCWSVRFIGKRLSSVRSISTRLLFYVANDDLLVIEKSLIKGKNSTVGEFAISTTESSAKFKGINVPGSEIWKIKDFLENETFDVLPNSNIALIECTFEDEFLFDVNYVSNSWIDSSIEFNDNLFMKQTEKFNRNFIKRFPMNLSPEHIDFGKFALSNLLGGISYFYGTSLIQIPDLGHGKGYSYGVTPQYSLFTDVPSRSTFPRGFLWDTGFHNLVICRWNLKLSLEILSNWISLIDENGWIGREQILGDEARSKVPIQLQPQNPQFGNPPALLFPIMSIVNQIYSSNYKQNAPSVRSQNVAKLILKVFYDKLKKNYRWFLQTQRAKLHPAVMPDKNMIPSSALGLYKTSSVNKIRHIFQWKGRSLHHTLTSGLDDYPRGNYPNRYEIHVDLMCWMYFMSNSLDRLAKFLNVHEGSYKYMEIATNILECMKEFSLDPDSGLYFDRSIDQEGNFVYNRHFGYINLFPLIFKAILPDSSEFTASFRLMKEKLCSSYGIMSMAKDDLFYGKGDNYWTGPIWVNINYLILSSLYTFYIPRTSESRLKMEICKFYDFTRKALISNMLNQYKLTGYIWEQYNPETGAGQRSHQFTGWSSLILLIMTEQYTEDSDKLYK